MIEGIELTIYLQDDVMTVDLSPIQTEVVFKVLGLQFNSNEQTVSSFSDNSLQQHILPKLHFVSK